MTSGLSPMMARRPSAASSAVTTSCPALARCARTTSRKVRSSSITRILANFPPGAPCRCRLARRGVLDDLLVDGAEDRLAARVEHLYFHAIAELQVGRDGFSFAHRLERADLGDAGVPALVTVVGDRPRAEHAPRAETARFRRVRDQVREVELHVGAAVGSAELLVVDVHGHR